MNTPFFCRLKKHIEKTGGIKKVLFFSAVYALVLVLFFSCQNSPPAVSNVHAKVVFDYENEMDSPVQKLSFFLQMTSDSRRVESLQLYHKESEFRWIVSRPLITGSGQSFYAGYTSCAASSDGTFFIPAGGYSVCCIDAQGNESYSEFSLDYDVTMNEKNFAQVKPELEKIGASVFIGVYSERGELLYYGLPKKKWIFADGSGGVDAAAVFTETEDSSFFRMFYESGTCVYIAPKTFKNE